MAFPWRSYTRALQPSRGVTPSTGVAQLRLAAQHRQEAHTGARRSHAATKGAAPIITFMAKRPKSLPHRLRACEKIAKAVFLVPEFEETRPLPEGNDLHRIL